MTFGLFSLVLTINIYWPYVSFLQGALRSSHQISPQEFLGELKSGVMDERLFACLDSLRVSLTSNPVRYSTLIMTVEKEPDVFSNAAIVFGKSFSE